MPGNLAAASPVGVLPKMLFTAFAEAQMVPVLSAVYHDGTPERSLIVDGVNPAAVVRNWKLSVRLVAASIDELRTFHEDHADGTPFYFYSPFEQLEGMGRGSNHDDTGVSTQGRYTVRFRGEWAEVSGIALSDVSFELQEIL